MILHWAVLILSVFIGYTFASWGWPKINIKIGNRKEENFYYLGDSNYDKYEDERIDEEQRQMLNN